jgi:hypothetical protein
MNTKRWILAGLIALTAETAVGSIIFADGTFASGDWNSFMIVGSFPVNASFFQSATGGNPGPFHQATLNLGSHSGGWGVVNRQFVHAPATDGEITSIDFSFDTFADPPSQSPIFIRLLAIQDGISYASIPFGRAPNPNGQWVSFAFSGLTASDFSIPAGGSGSPNFSSSGNPIRFGYFASGSVALAGPARGGVDNVSIGIVPEPSTGALFLFGVMLSGKARIRRRKAHGA